MMHYISCWNMLNKFEYKQPFESCRRIQLTALYGHWTAKVQILGPHLDLAIGLSLF